jgi:hypothetical protein
MNRNASSLAWYRRWRLPGPYFWRRREHIMGVTVNETTMETATATAGVTANSRSNRPGISPMNKRGMKTAMSDTLIERTVNVISPEPFRDASIGCMPDSRWRIEFSSTTIASSTTNPVAIVRAMSDRLSILNFNRYMTAKVPTRDRMIATAGMMVARM